MTSKTESAINHTVTSTKGSPAVNHVMLDLETLGVKQGSIILSLAAIEFDIQTGVTGKIFYRKINVQSCIDAGLTLDGDTFIWWLKQSEQARAEIYEEKDSNTLPIVLKEFNDFMLELNPDKRTKIWGNGASFDLGLLSCAYKACKQTIPWMFWNERDVRTIVDLAPNIKKSTPFVGVEHNPVDDCLYQIKYVSEIWNYILS